MSNPKPETRPLSERMFEKNFVTIPWIILVAALFQFVGMPLAKALVVCWVKGSDAYFRQGMRIPRSTHPLHFTDGTLVPEFQYFLVIIVLFFFVVGGLSLLLIRLVKFYERHLRKSPPR